MVFQWSNGIVKNVENTNTHTHMYMHTAAGSPPRSREGEPLKGTLFILSFSQNNKKEKKAVEKNI